MLAAESVSSAAWYYVSPGSGGWMHSAAPAAPPRPDDLPALKRWLAAQPDAAALHELAIQQITIASNALVRLPGLLADLGAPAAPSPSSHPPAAR